jgi:uncharacterized protein (DUF302 family)
MPKALEGGFKLFNYTVETIMSLQQAVIALEENLIENKFGVLWNLDLTTKLRSKGQDFNTPYMILEVCNPKETNNMLTNNLLVGYFLPCKIVIYVEEGTTKIGMPKPTELIGPTGDPNLLMIATNIENQLISCIDKSIQ